MKIKYGQSIVAFLFVFVILFNAISMAVDAFSFDMDELPTGKMLSFYPSPDNSKTLTFYLVEIERTNTAIRGELLYTNENGEKETRNIYWQVGAKTVQAVWVDENIAIVNENEVYINGDPYDSRTQIILPEYSAKNRIINE